MSFERVYIGDDERRGYSEEDEKEDKTTTTRTMDRWPNIYIYIFIVEYAGQGDCPRVQQCGKRERERYFKNRILIRADNSTLCNLYTCVCMRARLMQHVYIFLFYFYSSTDCVCVCGAR